MPIRAIVIFGCRHSGSLLPSTQKDHEDPTTSDSSRSRADERLRPDVLTQGLAVAAGRGDHQAADFLGARGGLPRQQPRGGPARAVQAAGGGGGLPTQPADCARSRTGPDQPGDCALQRARSGAGRDRGPKGRRDGAAGAAGPLHPRPDRPGQQPDRGRACRFRQGAGDRPERRGHARQPRAASPAGAALSGGRGDLSRRPGRRALPRHGGLQPRHSAHAHGGARGRPGADEALPEPAQKRSGHADRTKLPRAGALRRGTRLHGRRAPARGGLHVTRTFRRLDRHLPASVRC